MLCEGSEVRVRPNVTRTQLGNYLDIDEMSIASCAPLFTARIYFWRTLPTLHRAGQPGRRPQCQAASWKAASKLLSFAFATCRVPALHTWLRCRREIRSWKCHTVGLRQRSFRRLRSHSSALGGRHHAPDEWGVAPEDHHFIFQAVHHISRGDSLARRLRRGGESAEKQLLNRADPAMPHMLADLNVGKGK